VDEPTSGLCTECATALHPGDKFCPECGHHVPTVEVEPQEQEEEAQPATGPKRTTMRNPFMIVGIAALGLVLVGAAIWGLTRDTAAEEQYQTSGPVLVSSLDDMAGAQSSQMVRDVAVDAQTQVTTIDTTLQDNPDERLATLRDAFAALAALRAYEMRNTEVWTDNRAPLEQSLSTLSSYGGVTQSASGEGQDAVRTLDDLTRRIDKAMATYRKQVKKARAAAQSQRSELRTYHGQMEYLIDQYTSLRNDTGAFTTRMDNEQMYMSEVVDYFTQAATDRREIRDQMARLRPPLDLRAVHSRIVTVLGDGADGIDSAVAAIEDADCYYGECYFEYNTQWQQFEDESSRITVRYADAYDSWQAAVARAEKRAKGADLPTPPRM
jgi:hypothetical protein